MSKRKKPDWNNQVKLDVGRHHSNTGDWHRALDVARKIFDQGIWDGSGLLVIIDPWETHRHLANTLRNDASQLKEGEHYRFAPPL